MVEGIREVSTALKVGTLFIVEDCKETLREFNSYVWDAKAQKSGEDKPIKKNDHALDALRYYVFTRKSTGDFRIY